MLWIGGSAKFVSSQFLQKGLTVVRKVATSLKYLVYERMLVVNIQNEERGRDLMHIEPFQSFLPLPSLFYTPLV